MPNGKAAGEPCVNLDLESMGCQIWGREDYPGFCAGFSPEVDFCGSNRTEGLQILSMLEVQTAADTSPT